MREALIQYRGAVLLALVLLTLFGAALATKIRIHLQERQRARALDRRLRVLTPRDDLVDVGPDGRVTRWRSRERG